MRVLMLQRTEFTRRRLLRDAMTIVGAVAAGAVPHQAFARQGGNDAPSGAVDKVCARKAGNADPSGAGDSTLALARAVNRMRYEDLPARAIEHAKMILASTLSSAAPGARIDSARILRDVATERGGRGEPTVWFD